MTSAFIHPQNVQIVVGSTLSATRRRPMITHVPPQAVGAIAAQLLTQGAGTVQIPLGSYFDGSDLVYALQSAVAGVTIAGSILTISDAAVQSSASVTVTASNAYGAAASQSFTREVRAQAAGGSVTVADFVRDGVVHDLGTSGGQYWADVPLSGTAGAGSVIEARAVSLDDFGLATTDWAPVATADGVGDWSGPMRVDSYSGSRFRAEVRLQAAPATMAATPRTFCVGHVAIDIGQSERFRIRSAVFHQNSTPDAFVTPDQAVRQLAAPMRVGRVQPSASQPFTVGVDPLPPGITRSGRELSVNKSTYDGAPFDHWYVPDHYFELRDERFVMRHCKMEVVTDRTLPWMLKTMNGGGFRLIERCDFKASEAATSFTAFLRTDVAGSGLAMMAPKCGTFVRNRLTGAASDFLKPASGTYIENVFEQTWNVPGVPVLWDSGATYAKSVFVMFNNNIFKSKIDGNTGNQPPSNQSDNASWLSHNPHSDLINPQMGVQGGMVIARNLILADSGRTAGNTLRGSANMLFRMDRDPAFSSNRYDRVLIEENVVIRDPGNVAYLISLENGANIVAPPVIRGNVLTQNNTGNGGFLYPGTSPAGTEWTDNRRTDGTLIAQPAQTVAGSYTPSTELAVQFASHDDASINPVGAINSARPVNASLTALANMLASEYPGRRFVVGSATKSGSSIQSMMNDSDKFRMWSHYAAFLAYLCPGGQPGTVMMDWQANDQGLGLGFAERIFPRLTGYEIDGTPVVLPGVIGGATHADHTLGDAHAPWTRTRILLCGPGVRNPKSQMSAAILTSTGGTEPMMRNYDRIQGEYRDMAAAAAGAGIIHPFVGVQPLTHYCVGTDVHPEDHQDGLPVMAKSIGLEALQGLGLLPPEFVVKFDQSYFAPDGSYAEFWSSAGPVTTTRRARGLPPMDGGQPHQTEVFSWEVGLQGVPESAHSATITAGGRVRVLPNSGTFANGDRFGFGRGGASGMRDIRTTPGDLTTDSAQRYDLNYPGVDMGFFNLEIVPIEPSPPAVILTVSGVT